MNFANIKIPNEILPKVTTIDRLRAKHHAVARLFALGKTIGEVTAETGYTYNSVKLVKEAPAFKELIAFYEKSYKFEFFESAGDYATLAIDNMVTAESMITDKLNDAMATGEDLPTKELLAISRDAADRFGFGKKNTQVNVNVDFANRLEAAIKRSGVKTIEAKAQSTALPPPAETVTVISDNAVTAQPSLPPEPAPTIRRRI